MFDNVEKYERTSDGGMYIKFNLLKAVGSRSCDFPNVEVTLKGDGRLIGRMLGLLEDGCQDVASVLRK